MIVELVGAGLLAATASFPLVPVATGSQPKPPVGIRLPDDRLTLMAGNHLGATFIEPASVVWTGNTAEVTTYTVFEPPHAIAKGEIVVQAVNRHRIDCSARTRQDLGSEAYDEAGKSLVWLPERPAEPIAPGSSHDFLARVLCDKVELPATNDVIGHAAARAVVLRIMEGQR